MRGYENKKGGGRKSPSRRDRVSSFKKKDVTYQRKESSHRRAEKKSRSEKGLKLRLGRKRMKDGKTTPVKIEATGGIYTQSKLTRSKYEKMGKEKISGGA